MWRRRSNERPTEPYVRLADDKMPARLAISAAEARLSVTKRRRAHVRVSKVD